MGYLHELNFTFDPLDMDADLRRAGMHSHLTKMQIYCLSLPLPSLNLCIVCVFAVETSLQKFAGSLAMKYATFLLGFENPNTSTGCRCTCHRNITSTTPSQTIGCKGCYKHHFKMLEYE